MKSMKNWLIDAAQLVKSRWNGIRCQLIPNVAGLLALNFNFGLTAAVSSSLLSFDELFGSPLTYSSTTYIRDVGIRRFGVVNWLGVNGLGYGEEVSGRRVELRLYHLLQVDQETKIIRKQTSMTSEIVSL